MYERPGYSTLFSRIRENVRTLIRKQLELPRQEIAELVQANLGAAKWLAIAGLLGFLFLFSFVILLVAVIAIWLPLPLAALIVTLVLLLGAGLTGLKGWRSLELHGPTRSIASVKETISWAKQRLLGQSES